jgi:UDP-N-acetylglucosamine 2-epimerase (non-hydrolysing)
MIKILLIAGARPNFMKIAPIHRATLNYDDVECRIVHTGQHYDYEMSQTFFEDLEIPKPDFFLDAGSGSHAVQTACIMVEFEKICLKEEPDIVVVVGDVNSTLACSVVAKKLMIKVAHVEAGLRSFDLSMPEEVNRMVTDSISDLFFVTETSGMENLVKEGKPESCIHIAGNVMVDNLLYQVKKLEDIDIKSFSTYKAKEEKKEYAFLTLHRPSNVDEKACFEEIVGAINKIADDFPIFFPIHPRTKKMSEKFNIIFSDNIILLPPLGFRESLFLWKDASFILTDSGGLQEETTALGVPCFTIRENTERPVTVSEGTNTLVGTKTPGILEAYEEYKKGNIKKGRVPEYWDGKAAERILNTLLNID